MDSHHHSADHSELGHEVPNKIFLTILIALLVLTVITVTASRMDFGSMNLVIAMVIASIKAALVLLFFMHAKYENPLVWLYIAVPIFTLIIMFGGIFIDNPLRVLPEPFAETKVQVGK